MGFGLDSAIEQALALQQWFRDPANFTYDLRQQPGTGKWQLGITVRDPDGKEALVLVPFDVRDSNQRLTARQSGNGGR